MEKIEKMKNVDPVNYRENPKLFEAMDDVAKMQDLLDKKNDALVEMLSNDYPMEHSDYPDRYQP